MGHQGAGAATGAVDLDALAAAGLPVRLYEGDRDVTDLFTRTDGPGRTITFHLGEVPDGRTVCVVGRSVNPGDELTLTWPATADR